MENLRVKVDAADCLSALPVDIIMTVIGLLPPHDILSVCKLMLNVTRERSVWIEALRRLCIQYDIYMPSFQWQRMSLDELEYAATASCRFSLHLRAEFARHRLVLPHSIRHLDPRHIGEEFENMRFIPGGRFLLTTNGTTIKLWDLGKHANCPTQHAIASVDVGGTTSITTLRTRAFHSSSEVLIILSTTGSDFRVHVFTIFPPASTPEFILFAPVLVLPETGKFPGILGATSRHVVVETAFNTVLWDFVEDTWISWSRDPTEIDNTIYLCNNNVVLVHADEAQLYVGKLPTLFPRSVFPSPPVINPIDIIQQFALCRFNQDTALEWCVSGMTLVFHGREHSSVDRPFHLDILTHDCGKVLLTHLALVPASNSSLNQTDDTLAPYELVPLGESPLDAVYSTSHSLHLEWLGCGTVQSFVVAGSTLHVCLSDVNGKTSASVEGVLLTPGLQEDDMNVDFCSFSGRVCARVPLEKGNGFRLAIMDYLTPKPSKQSSIPSYPLQRCLQQHLPSVLRSG
ncbi:hypothetical protein K438DRAFT_1964356 [Mycena galopus ATCC 62051]|nr:hypothetical protein K438DRAFT_1964356 [Mycena galopus ATCC 62051]